jgi:hypothetical protein
MPKKERKNSSYVRKAVAKSYMTNCLLIYDFLIYEENVISFLSVCTGMSNADRRGALNELAEEESKRLLRH